MHKVSTASWVGEDSAREDMEGGVTSLIFFVSSAMSSRLLLSVEEANTIHILGVPTVSEQLLHRQSSYVDLWSPKSME